MIGKRIVLFLLFVLTLLVALMSSAPLGPLAPLPALADSTARCNQDMCVSNCLFYQYFFASHTLFYNGFMNLSSFTECDNPTKTAAEYLFHATAEILGIDLAPTLNCWQMIAGQANVCSNQCNGYHIKSCRYTPNVRTQISSCDSGDVVVNIDNHTNTGDPDVDSNAYSRASTAKTYLRRGSDRILLKSSGPLYLSYPTWIDGDEVAACRTTEDEEHQHACDILDALNMPSEVSDETTWGGKLVSLAGLTSNSHGVTGDPANGYVRLLSDGNSITINQGTVSGQVYVWDHNIETGAIDETVTDWSALNGQVNISNHECNCYWCACNATGVRRDVDTTVFATSGPDDRVVLGGYSVEVETWMAHDRNTANDSATCTYTLDAPPPPPPTPSPTPPGGSGGQQGLTPQLIFEGVYTGTISTGELGDLYLLTWGPVIADLRIFLDVAPTADFDLYVRRNQAPELQSADYDCDSAAGSAASEFCWLTPGNSANSYYILVHPYYSTGSYTLTVEINSQVSFDLVTVPRSIQESLAYNHPLRRYAFDVPAGAPSQMVITLDVPPDSDFNLNVRQGGLPARFQWASSAYCDYATPPNGIGKQEQCIVSTAIAGWRYFVDIARVKGVGDFNLDISFVAPTPTLTRTHTATPSATRTATPTPTARPGTPTRTATRTRTFTSTARPSTSTRTATQTRTPTPTRAPTRTRTWTPLPPPSRPTNTPTATRTSTRVPPSRPTTTATATMNTVAVKNLWGWVHDENNVGVSGVTIVLQLGRSDALQVVGVTTDGTYKRYMDIPDNVTCTVWAEKSGYTFSPPSYQWFHTSGGEDRQMDFAVADMPGR